MTNRKLYILFIAIIVSAKLYGQNDIINRFNLAKAYQDAGQIDKAIPIYEDVYSRQPVNRTFIDALNNAYISLKMYDKSIDILSKSILKNRQDIDLYGMLGSSYYLKGNDSVAFKTWEAAMPYVTQSYQYFSLANFIIERRAFDKAIQILNAGRKRFPEDDSFLYELSNLYVFVMNYKAATKELCELMKKNPSQFEFVQNKLLQLATNKRTANEIIDMLSNYKSLNRNFMLTLGMVYLQVNMYEKALEISKELDSQGQKDGNEILSFANRCYLSKNYIFSMKAYKEFLKCYPNSVMTRAANFSYAKSLELLLADSSKIIFDQIPEKKTGIILDQYSDVITAYKNVYNGENDNISSEAAIRLAKIYCEKVVDFDSALHLCEKIIENSNHEYVIEALKIKSEIYLKSGKLDEFEDVNNQFLQSTSIGLEKTFEAKYRAAFIYFFRGKFSESQRLFAEVANETSLEFANDALELSLLINYASQDSLNLAEYSKAEYFKVQGKYKEAENLLLNVYSKAQNFLLKDVCVLKIAENYVIDNNYSEALKILGECSNTESIYADDITYLIAEIYNYGYKDKGKAKEWYEKLLEKFPNSIYISKSVSKLNFIRETITEGRQN